MTRVNSPRGSTKRASASLNVPRNTSSNFFVSSRQTATRRAPGVSRRAGGAAGEEAQVGELADGQAGDGEGGGDGGGAGDGRDGEAGFHRRGDEIQAGV